jgi:[acyl-carrier-protein] S-malonyltransferase
MPENIAFLFPGQGSQFVGMGQELTESFPETKSIFEQVDALCQKPISTLCFEGPMEELTLTENLQPAVTAVNLACLTALNVSGIRASISAGHSLGEYAALVSAGVLGSYDALRLAQKRGELMQREADSHPGSMMAVVGLDWEAVSRIIGQAETEGVVSIANHNTADQIVITGERAPLSRAVRLVKEKRGKAIPLKVSGAWHCKLMEGAVGEFHRFMEEIPFSAPQSRIFFNATAEMEEDPEAIKDIMAKQLVSPVKWYDIVLKMLQGGIDTFVEVGPKKVLSGLVKKIAPPEMEIGIHSVENSEGLKSLLESL